MRHVRSYPIADIDRWLRNIRFVPEADIRVGISSPSRAGGTASKSEIKTPSLVCQGALDIWMPLTQVFQKY